MNPTTAENLTRAARVAVRTAQITWAALQLLALAAVITGEVLYERRQQIREAAIAAYAWLVIAAEETYAAGKATGNWVARIGDAAGRAATATPEVLAPVAPIVAVATTVAKSAATAFADWIAEPAEEAEVEEAEEVETGTALPTLEELLALPAATLREMAGTNRRYPKAKLAGMILAA